MYYQFVILVVAIYRGQQTFDILGFHLASDNPHMAWEVRDLFSEALSLQCGYGGVFLASDKTVWLLDSVNVSRKVIHRSETNMRHITCSDSGCEWRVAISHGLGNIKCYTVTAAPGMNDSEKWQIRIPDQQ